MLTPLRDLPAFCLEEERCGELDGDVGASASGTCGDDSSGSSLRSPHQSWTHETWTLKMPNVRDATIKMRHLRGTTLQNAACDGVEMHPDAPLVMRALRCRASRIA